MTNVVPITRHESHVSSARDFRQCFDPVSEYADSFWADLASALRFSVFAVLAFLGALNLANAYWPGL